MITSHDANLSGISLSVMDIVPITASAPMNVTVNWYMAIASTLVLVPIGTFVTDRIIEPKFGGWRASILWSMIPTGTCPRLR